MKRNMPAWLAVAVLALVVAPFAFAGINSTSDPNQTVDGTPTGDCVKPSAAMPVNCNQYAQKQDVFLNGSPSKDVAGTYFFAVLDPGGQADPNDGTAKNLSDLPGGDAAINREFSVAGDGTIINLGSHGFDAANNALSVYPFDDTSNPGGVYILAVCKISDSENTTAIAVPAVAGGDCKYDAFKVGSNPIPTAADLTVTKDASGANTDTWTWGIQKSVDTSEIDDSTGSATFNYTVTVTHDSGTVSGVQVTGTISVFNPNVDNPVDNNTIPVDITGVTDQLSDGTNCDVTGGGPQTLTLAKTKFAYTCDLSSLPQGQLDNTVTVSWDGQLLSNGSFLGANSANFTFTGITLTQTNVDDCVDVNDTLYGDFGNVCQSNPSPTNFPYPYTFSGDPAGTCTDHDNTATISGDTSGGLGSASQSVKQCVGEDLSVSKTAAPSYTRTYNWNIAKSVDKPKVTTSGSSATFNYTVTANQTGYTNSAIQATGSITVTNHNDWEPVTLTGVTDAVNNGGSCSLTGGNSSTSTIAAGGSATLNYTCTYSSLPAAGTNTATASWDPAAAFTPHGSAQGTAGVTFGSPTSSVNKTITPADTFSGGPAVNLCTLTSTPALYCTLTGTDASPFTSHTYKYSRTITVVPGCVNYTNTAATGTGPTSSKTVTVCQLVSGGLTMGFWQNKNGQGIITGDKSTAGVCNLATWLRNYLPFQDLSATASCSAVATYVSNVIKAATCSSSDKTCNTMLKAQMLATALDVYFSDPALGGDKIFAFNGGNSVKLGSVKIDLTTICSMLDGSSGATCTGSESASSAFGGATCLSINDLLAYAASKSNVGGSVWYAQVKATQVLAKDTFDSINNSQAQTC